MPEPSDEHDTLGRFTGGNNNLNNLLENGSIGSKKLKIYPEITNLLREKGMASRIDDAMKPVKIKILSLGIHGSKRLAKRYITLADNAFIMIK